MIGYTLFSLDQGAGYIHTSREEILKEKRPVDVTVNGEIINPGDKTNLSGHFALQMEYCGLLGENEMIFFIGTMNDLFETKYYYQSVHLISDTRIFEMFNTLGGRDFNFINGKWK
jgi:hypothetical protein